MSNELYIHEEFIFVYTIRLISVILSIIQTHKILFKSIVQTYQVLLPFILYYKKHIFYTFQFLSTVITLLILEFTLHNKLVT